MAETLRDVLHRPPRQEPIRCPALVVQSAVLDSCALHRRVEASRDQADAAFLFDRIAREGRSLTGSKRRPQGDVDRRLGAAVARPDVAGRQFDQATRLTEWMRHVNSALQECCNNILLIAKMCGAVSTARALGAGPARQYGQRRRRLAETTEGGPG
ncbi:hypothetical protein KY389_06530 [Paracoccus bogoriensis]|uniref:hypothetical protein n=1 Tax=Paracoccus bogoriensis TaxID=242065 RepID=UPI001CA4E42D|nr:hypothetical protein [Paracoccus bogoriensis]MBW7056352.1 hypothetical protein [Paracoccus bogoriensis]